MGPPGGENRNLVIQLVFWVTRLQFAKVNKKSHGLLYQSRRVKPFKIVTNVSVVVALYSERVVSFSVPSQRRPQMRRSRTRVVRTFNQPDETWNYFRPKRVYLTRRSFSMAWREIVAMSPRVEAVVAPRAESDWSLSRPLLEKMDIGKMVSEAWQRRELALIPGIPFSLVRRTDGRLDANAECQKLIKHLDDTGELRLSVNRGDLDSRIKFHDLF